jgi:hypothetical protein
VSTCERCNAELPHWSRSDRRFCTNRCRVAASRARERKARASAPLAVPSPLESRDVASELDAAVERATREARLVAHVAKAANDGQWRAAVWLLEHRYPERWALRSRVDEPPPPAPAGEDDPFVEVDELAARRRRTPPGYES